MDNNINQMNEPKRTKKGLIIGCILIALGLFIGILLYNSYKTYSPIIDQSRLTAMRSKATYVIKQVKNQLNDNYELVPGSYEFDANVMESENNSAPMGGEYVYAKEKDNKIGLGVYRLNETKDVIKDCGPNKASFVNVERDEEDKFIYSVCLSTTKNVWLAGTETQIINRDDAIFFGDAKK